MKIENEYIALLLHDRLIIKNPKTEKETILYRIIAKKSFIVENKFDKRPIQAHKTGGFVESVDILDEENYSWIDNRCRIFGNLKISNSIITDSVVAYGTGEINGSMIKHNARIYLDGGIITDSSINDLAEVKGHVNVTNSELYNSAMIFENATVTGCDCHNGSIIRGDATVIDSQLRDVSQVQGQSILKNCKLLNRAVVMEGEHENMTFSEDIILNIIRGVD